MTSDPSAAKIRRTPTRAEELVRPLPAERIIKENPEPSAEAQRTADELAGRVDRYRTGRTGRTGGAA
jgi:hypothetical protein